MSRGSAYGSNERQNEENKISIGADEGEQN